MSAIASVRGVTRNYQQGPHTVRALRGVDLDVQEGDFLALMGPSGSGKSTLLNLFGGLDLPSEGEVQLAHERKRAAHRPRSAGEDEAAQGQAEEGCDRDGAEALGEAPEDPRGPRHPGDTAGETRGAGEEETTEDDLIGEVGADGGGFANGDSGHRSSILEGEWTGRPGSSPERTSTGEALVTVH